MPTTPNEEILAEIRQANERLDRIEAQLDRLGAGRPTAPASPAAPFQPADKPIADDRDLDSQYGDPEVRRDPKDWTGASCVGLRYSQCPPEFLDMLAGLLDWQSRKSAEKNEMTANGKPRADYLARDAARARGHAARLRAKPAGRKPPPRQPPPDDEPPPF